MSPRRLLLGRVVAQLEIAIVDINNSTAEIDKGGSNIYDPLRDLHSKIEEEIEAEDASVIA